jgi:hypothetical protein
MALHVEAAALGRVQGPNHRTGVASVARNLVDGIPHAHHNVSLLTDSACSFLLNEHVRLRRAAMRISYNLTLKDMFEAQGKHGGWRNKVLPILGLPLFAIGLVHLIHDPTQIPSPVAIIAPALFLTCFVKLQVWLSFRRDNRLTDQFEAVISDSGIDVSSSKLATKYNWNAFTRYAETKNLSLVYQAPQCVNIFPSVRSPLGKLMHFGLCSINDWARHRLPIGNKLAH